MWGGRSPPLRRVVRPPLAQAREAHRRLSANPRPDPAEAVARGMRTSTSASPEASRSSLRAVLDYAMSRWTVVWAATADSSAATPATSAVAAAKGSGLVPPPRIAPAMVVAAVHGR